MAFTQAASPPEDTTHSAEEQKSGQKDEEESQERPSSPQPQGVSGPEMDNDQSEPVEDAASLPVVDTVTDTEGT